MFEERCRKMSTTRRGVLIDVFGFVDCIDVYVVLSGVCFFSFVVKESFPFLPRQFAEAAR